MSSNLVSRAERIAARDAFLEAGAWEVAADFSPYTQFASGDDANNKVDMVKLIAEGQLPEIQEAILRPMGKLVLACEADALWGIPTGGQLYAQKIGERLELPVIQLIKVDNLPGDKTYGHDPKHLEENLKIISQCENMVGIEDALSKATSLFGALFQSPELEEMAAKTRAIVTGLRRGAVTEEKKLGKPVHSVYREHIPNLITPEHPFFQKHGHQAVRRTT